MVSQDGKITEMELLLRELVQFSSESSR
jgi:hypothetical protein